MSVSELCSLFQSLSIKDRVVFFITFGNGQDGITTRRTNQDETVSLLYQTDLQEEPGSSQKVSVCLLLFLSIPFCFSASSFTFYPPPVPRLFHIFPNIKASQILHGMREERHVKTTSLH